MAREIRDLRQRGQAQSDHHGHAAPQEQRHRLAAVRAGRRRVQAGHHCNAARSGGHRAGVLRVRRVPVHAARQRQKSGAGRAAAQRARGEFLQALRVCHCFRGDAARGRRRAALLQHGISAVSRPRGAGQAIPAMLAHARGGHAGQAVCKGRGLCGGHRQRVSRSRADPALVCGLAEERQGSGMDGQAHGIAGRVCGAGVVFPLGVGRPDQCVRRHDAVPL